jgi:uncharacterized protein YoxC
METSLILIAVFTGVIALSNLILLCGLAFLAIAVKRLLEKSVIPAASEAKSTIASVNDLVKNVESKAERIMDIGEDAARKVSGKVATAADVAGETIAAPLIGISSALAGISKALEVLRSRTSKAAGRPNSKST